MGEPATLTLLRGDGQPVVDRCTVADTPLRRLRGLLGRPALQEAEGMVLRPAWGIYTGFLRSPIDVIFLDANQRVLRIVEHLRPFRYAGCRGARDVIEAGAGTCRARGLEEGASVLWAAFASEGRADDLELHEPQARVRTPARVVIGSADRDFLRTSRFLLEHRDWVVEAVVRLAEIPALVARTSPDLVVIDAGPRVAEAARVVASIEELHVDVEIALVGDAPRKLPGLRIGEKWSALEQLVGSSSEELPLPTSTDGGVPRPTG